MIYKKINVWEMYVFDSGVFYSVGEDFYDGKNYQKVSLPSFEDVPKIKVLSLKQIRMLEAIVTNPEGTEELKEIFEEQVKN